MHKYAITNNSITITPIIIITIPFEKYLTGDLIKSINDWSVYFKKELIKDIH